MPLVPYVEDVEAIMDHIVKGKKGPIQMRSNPPPFPPVTVKWVTPIQQQVEMVNAQLRDKNKEERQRSIGQQSDNAPTEYQYQIKHKEKIEPKPWFKY